MKKLFRQLVLVALLITGCASSTSPAQSIIGTWRSSEMPEMTISFKKGGTVTTTMTGVEGSAEFSMKGTYRLLSDKRMQVKYAAPPEMGASALPSEATDFEINDKVMVMIGADGTRHQWERIE